MSVCRCSLLFIVLLTFTVGKNAQASPVPFLPYDQADSTEAVLRLAESEGQPWVVELQPVSAYGANRTHEVLTNYESLILRYVTDARALEFLIPLYWQQTALFGETSRRWNLFLDLARQSKHLLLLALTENLLQHHAQWRLSELKRQPERSNENHYEDHETWLQIKGWYDQLLLATQSSDGQEPEIFLHVWLNALLYFYAPSGGLRVADAYLLDQAGQGVHPDLITIYRKMFHDLAGKPMVSHQQGSWLLPGAGADMTTQEMGEQATWAFNSFNQQDTANKISSTWRSLQAAVICFHRAQGNPQMVRFQLCLAPYQAAYQGIKTLEDMLYIGPDSKRRSPWADMYEWNRGDREYIWLVHEFNLITGLKDRVVGGLQEKLQQQMNHVRSIQEPEEQIQANLNLLDNPLADIVSPEQKQQARNQLQANLYAIQTQKSRNAAAQRFNAQQKVLLDQLRQNALDEVLWDQYLALLNSGDAEVSLDSDFRLREIANAKQLRQRAKEENYSRHLLGVFKQQEALIQKRYQENPIQALQDYRVLLNSEAGRSLPNHGSLVTQTLTDLHARQAQQRKAEAAKAFYEQRAAYDQQATVTEDPLQVWQIYLEKLNDPGRTKDLSSQLVQGEVQRVERTMQEYRTGQANALNAELMSLGQKATSTSPKLLWEEFVRLLEEDPRARYLDDRQQALAIARTQLKIYEDSAEPDPEILLARAEKILSTARDVPEVWRQQQLKIIREEREMLRAERIERENQARLERIREDQSDSIPLSTMPEPPPGNDVPNHVEQEFNRDINSDTTDEEPLSAHDSLWSELGKDTEPPSFCETENCPDGSLEESQLLASVLNGLELIGQGEDPASIWVGQQVEFLTDNLLRFSYERSPELTRKVISALATTGDLVEASFDLLDEATGQVVSQTWNSLDESTRNRIKGGEKVVSAVLLPLGLSKKALEISASALKTAKKARGPAPSLKNDPYHPDVVEDRRTLWRDHYGHTSSHDDILEQAKRGATIDLFNVNNIWNRNNGILGEELAQRFLEKMGLDVKVLQNNSKHGVDLIHYDPVKNEYLVIEVKSSWVDRYPLSAAQRRGPSAYLRTQADKAAGGEGFWRPENTPQGIKADGEKIVRKLNGKYETPATVKGIKMEVAIPKAGESGTPSLTVKEWN